MSGSNGEHLLRILVMALELCLNVKRHFANSTALAVLGHLAFNHIYRIKLGVCGIQLAKARLSPYTRTDEARLTALHAYVGFLHIDVAHVLRARQGPGCHRN